MEGGVSDGAPVMTGFSMGKLANIPMTNFKEGEEQEFESDETIPQSRLLSV